MFPTNLKTQTLQYWGFHWNSLFDVIFILQWVSAIILLAFVLWKWWILQGIQFQGWKNVLFIVNERFIFMLSTDWIIEKFESFCFTTQFSIHLAVNLARNTFFRILWRNNRIRFFPKYAKLFLSNVSIFCLLIFETRIESVNLPRFSFFRATNIHKPWISNLCSILSYSTFSQVSCIILILCFKNGESYLEQISRAQFHVPTARHTLDSSALPWFQ